MLHFILLLVSRATTARPLVTACLFNAENRFALNRYIYINMFSICIVFKYKFVAMRYGYCIIDTMCSGSRQSNAKPHNSLNESHTNWFDFQIRMRVRFPNSAPIWMWRIAAASVNWTILMFRCDKSSSNWFILLKSYFWRCFVIHHHHSFRLFS